MDFRERLERAAERGRQTRDAKSREEAARALSEEEYRRLHAKLRDELTEHIERCLGQLADGIPGFGVEPAISEKSWGAVARRDDLFLSGGRRENLFSRLELTVSAYNQYHVLEIVARGAIRNKENFTRNH